MPAFLKSIVVEAPVETVFGFHEREDALRLLSPRFPSLRVIRKTGGISLVREWNEGLFAKWVHRHEFESVGLATRLTDRVEYRLPGGVWMNRLFGWAVQLGLHQMFRQRHQTTRRYCEKGPNENFRA